MSFQIKKIKKKYLYYYYYFFFLHKRIHLTIMYLYHVMQFYQEDRENLRGRFNKF